MTRTRTPVRPRHSRARSAVYFVAPRRDGTLRVVPVYEHGPYHERQPASWYGPFASGADAYRYLTAQASLPAPTTTTPTTPPEEP